LFDPTSESPIFLPKLLVLSLNLLNGLFQLLKALCRDGGRLRGGRFNRLPGGGEGCADAQARRQFEKIWYRWLQWHGLVMDGLNGHPHLVKALTGLFLFQKSFAVFRYLGR
jgi:hypothetical protein